MNLDKDWETPVFHAHAERSVGSRTSTFFQCKPCWKKEKEDKEEEEEEEGGKRIQRNKEKEGEKMLLEHKVLADL